MKLRCEFCGKAFEFFRKKIYCSKKCANRASVEKHGGNHSRRLREELRNDRITRGNYKLAMNKRLAARDAAYAAEYGAFASGSVRGQCVGTVRGAKRRLDDYAMPAGFGHDSGR